MNGWQTPHLSVLNGTDKDALQSIFRSLQSELERLYKRIEVLESRVSNGFDGYRGTKGY